MQTFIFVHDESIVLNDIASGKFKELPDLQYVFLGARGVDRIRGLSNLIVCRELPIHLEAYPRLTSFSGWYALWKNKLISADYINLFEYDVDLAPDFLPVLEAEMQSEPSILGYVPLRVHNPLFIEDPAHIGNLLHSIQHHHGVDAAAMIRRLDKEAVCSRTSNHTFRRDVFEQYVEWMEPMIDDLKDTPMAGHHIERSISLFYLLEGIPEVRLRADILQHAQADSHATYPHSRGQSRQRGGFSRGLDVLFASPLRMAIRWLDRWLHGETK